MEIIENKFLKVSINPHGALLTSVIFKETNSELLYQVEKDSWPFQDVVIFPLIGAGKFLYEDKNYNLKTRHGFLRNNDLKVFEKEKSKITFSFSSNEETLLEYPFKFTFFITYELIDNSVKVTTKVKNNDNKTMYFSYGSHTGFKANSQIGNVVFDKDYQFLPLISGLIDENNHDNILLNCTNLKKESFQKRDTFVFKGMEEKLELITGFDSIKITYEFNAPYFAIWSNPNKGTYEFNAPYFAIWSNPNKGEYVRIEPWWGISNYVNESNYLEERKAINKLKENEETSFSYKYTFTKED